MIGKNQEHFFTSVLNTLPQHISILDSTGKIEWINHPWQQFSLENGGRPKSTLVDANYLDVCEISASSGDDDAATVFSGIQSVITGKEESFHFEYPCHAPNVQRWFMMSASPLTPTDTGHLVVSHTNITDRKLAEQQVYEQATTDGLTGIANRRHFDQFLEREWRLALREQHPISVILADIDHFKPYNDNYGHLQGDDCLKLVGAAIKTLGNRPGDLVARYGGEEFALVLGNTGSDAARLIAEKFRKIVADLALDHEFSHTNSVVTASVGVATCWPVQHKVTGFEELLQLSDTQLYKAKQSGRNCVVAIEV